MAAGVACLLAWLGPAHASTGHTQAARDISAPTTLPAQQPSKSKPADHAANLLEVLKRSTGLYHSMLGYLYLQGGNNEQAYANLIAAASHAPDSLLYQQATEIALRGRSPASAMRTLDLWRAALPQDTKASLYHLQLLIASGRIAQTSAPLQAVLDATEADKKQKFIHAIPDLYEPTRSPRQALIAASPVLEKAMQQPETAFISAASLARMQLAARQYPQALQSIQRALAAKAPSEKLGALPNQELPGLIALDLMQASKTSAPVTAHGAETVVRQYLTQKPSHDFALVYTRALIQARRLADAQQVLDTVLKQAPDFATGWFFQGTLQTEAKQWEAAQSSFLQYLKLRRMALLTPSAPEAPSALETGNGNDAQQQATARDLQAYLSLARIADARNKPQEARQWMDRIAPSPLSKQAQLQRIEWLVQEKKFDLALQLLPLLPAEAPREKAAVALLHSHILEKQGRYEDAVRILNPALEAEPDNAELLYARGNVYWQMEKFAELERDMRQVMLLQPDSPAAYNALGYNLADRNLRLGEARELIAKALDLAPQSAAIQDSMGWVEYRLGNLPRALELLQQAFETEPEAEIAAHYGEVLWKSGRQDEARTIWEQGLKLDARHKVLLETIKRLDGRVPATSP